MKLFEQLDVYHDFTPRRAALNMAVDEALLESAAAPSIRFYQWQRRALSFGYFGKFADVARYVSERDLIRRWTGGGIVFHGEDFTYSVVIPAHDPVFAESSISIYEKIHRALTEALTCHAKEAELVTAGPLNDRRAGDRRSLGNHCFTNPVRADVIINGRKIAGAAQRRTRSGLLQQGTIQGISLKTGFAESFAEALSANCSGSDINEEILDRARELAQRKYGTESWLRKR